MAHVASSQRALLLPWLCVCFVRSREAKKIFETALMESRRMSMSFITPEHILLAVLSVGDATSRRVFEGCARRGWGGWAGRRGLV